MDIITSRKYGPFIFENTKISLSSREWVMKYNGQVVATHSIPGTNVLLSELFKTFESDRNAFILEKQNSYRLPRIDLLDSKSGAVLAYFHTENGCDMLPNPINDSHQYWICSEDRLVSRAVTLTQWGQIVADNNAPDNAWISSLLPKEVLTNTPSEWRSPTSLELRHIVGEGSFTGITGAKAAELVGVSPQNFRKYTAQERASTHQKMGFAMWHLLLHKLEVKLA